MESAPFTRALLTVLLLAGSLWAQADAQRFERSLEIIKRERDFRADSRVAADQRALIDVGAYASVNFFNFQDPDAHGQLLLRNDLNLYANVNLDGAHQFYFRGLFRYDHWGDGDNDDGDDDTGEAELDRAFYRFDLARLRAAQGMDPGAINLTLTGGRQLQHWANGLVLSQVLDGAAFTLGSRSLSLEGLAGLTRKRTLDFDASRPEADDDTSRGFYGGMIRFRPVTEHEVFVYGLVQKDNNDVDFDPDPLAEARAENPGGSFPVLPTRYHYDSYYIGAGANGNLGDNLLYGLEAVYQGGEGRSNSYDSTGTSIPQTFEDIHAWAVDFRADWLFHDDNRSRASFQTVLASGDDDRASSTTDTLGGNLPGTDDHAFNAFGLTHTGLSFAPPMSNLLMFRLGVSTTPLPGHDLFNRLQVGVDFFIYNKLDEHAPIDETTSDDTFLGVEPDVFVQWQITSDLAWATRYGVFFPGEAILGDSSARHFVYSGLTLAF